MTASPDSTIRVWNVTTSQTTLLLRAHDAPVTGLSLHPTGDYLLSSSLDHYWAFSDIRTGRLLTKVFITYYANFYISDLKHNCNFEFFKLFSCLIKIVFFRWLVNQINPLPLLSFILMV